MLPYCNSPSHILKISILVFLKKLFFFFLSRFRINLRPPPTTNFKKRCYVTDTTIIYLRHCINLGILFKDGSGCILPQLLHYFFCLISLIIYFLLIDIGQLLLKKRYLKGFDILHKDGQANR